MNELHFLILLLAATTLTLVVVVIAQAIKNTTKPQPGLPIENSEFYKTSNLNPLSVRIENKCSENQLAIMFGKNLYANSANFGSQFGNEISTVSGGSYSELMQQSANYPFHVKCIRIYCENYAELFTRVITIKHHEASSFCITFPISLTEHEKKQSDRIQLEILDIPVDFWITGQTTLEISMPANTIANFTFFQDKELNHQHILECLNLS